MSAVKPSELQQFKALYSEHHGWLRGWLIKRIGCSHSAADLTQDTFLRVITRTDLSSVKEPKPWLLTIAKHIMIDKSRRAKIEQFYLEECKQLAEDNPAVMPSCEQLSIAVQTLENIAKALEDLPVNVKMAFILRFIDGLTFVEIARQLNVSHTMARRYLIQCLAAYHSVVNE